MKPPKITVKELTSHVLGFREVWRNAIDESLGREEHEHRTASEFMQRVTEIKVGLYSSCSLWY